MKTSSVLASLAVALPLVAAAPAPVAKSEPVVHIADYKVGEIQKRDDIPDSCLAMIDSRQQDAPEWRFYWLGDGEDNCAAEDRSNTDNCGQDGYWDTQINDMNGAVGQQVTKDGQFKSSQVGMWRATFGTFSLAVGDRQGFTDFVNTALKVTIPGNSEVGRYWHYRFNWQQDHIHLNLDNGGIFDANCPEVA